MAGRATRDKGRRGQQAAKRLLADRDWRVIEANSGEAEADMLAIDTAGRTWLVEVKNTAAITTAHREQAMRQAKAKRLPWMLMSHVAGTSDWLIQRQNTICTTWREKDGILELAVRGEVS